MMRALIVVDVQNDFVDGALSAQHTHDLIPALNNLIDLSASSGVLSFFTRDWHPPNHSSFRAQGGPWPPHCIQGTHGAEFPRELHIPKDATIISKGIDPASPGYSAFTETDLADRLAKLRVDSVVVCGIATEYCVRQTALDAIRLGLSVDLPRDLVRPVNSDDEAKAVDELKNAGVRIVATYRRILNRR